MKLAVAAAVVVGCASANLPDRNPGGGGDDGAEPDAAVPGPDAATPDGPPPPPPPGQDVTLSQVADMVPTTESALCANMLGDISAISLYRVFALADHQITGPFHVKQVSFGVYQTDDSPKATIKIGTYTGTLNGSTLKPGQITAIASTTVTVTGSSVVNKVVDVPITADIPAGSLLVIEVAAPSNAAGPQLILGSNNSAETKTGYVRSSPCNGPDAESLAVWGSPARHPLISAKGTK